jgi:hypothetical protein
MAILLIVAVLAAATYLVTTRPCRSGWHGHRHWRHRGHRHFS